MTELTIMVEEIRTPGTHRPCQSIYFEAQIEVLCLKFKLSHASLVLKHEEKSQVT